MGVTIFDLFGEIFSENDMINFLKENGIDPNGLIGGGLAIRCFLLLKVPVQIDLDHQCTPIKRFWQIAIENILIG